MRNTFGHIYTLTSFGESHGEVVGGVVDGFPAGIAIDLPFIQNELNRRRPGQSRLVSQRQEPDEVELLSGIFEGKSTGAPIGFIVRNTNAKTADYDGLRHVFRPSHADFTYQEKYGIRDHRGGGRSSARITIARCVAGALAKLALRTINVEIHAFTSQIGTVSLEADYRSLDLSLSESNDVRCPDGQKAVEMQQLIEQTRRAGDSLGGVVTCVVQGCPPGLGEPEFGKLHAALGQAMLSINAAKGFEYGVGFDGARLRGSSQNDAWVNDNGKIRPQTNHSGGIQGGISNGEDIYFRIAFKAVPTLMQPQQTVDTEGRGVVLNVPGRHDTCVVPRAVPLVESMAAMTILDQYLLSKTVRL